MNGKITLPPIVIRPDYPLPKPPTLPPTYIAKPLPWDGKVIAVNGLDSFFSKKGIKDERYTMTVVFTIASAQRSIEQSYLAYLPSLRSQIESEIATAVGTDGFSLLEKSKIEKAVMDSMIEQGNAELISSRATANAFFGRDPLARDIKKNAVDFVNIFQRPRNPNTPLNTYKKWNDSITAAYRSKILSEKIRFLTEKSNALTSTIATAQAEEYARLAAQAEAIKIAHTFRAQGSVAVAQPLFVSARGTIAIEGGGAALAAAIRAAIAGVVGFVVGSASSVIVGVIAFFAFPRELANGELPERYSFSAPLSELVPDINQQNLQNAAATNSTVDMPIRVSSKTAEDGRSEVFVVKTNGVTVPSKVRVIAANYDIEHKIYTATTADVPPRTLTWTPAVSPGDSSTNLPADPSTPPIYTGAIITPVEGRFDTFPAVSEGSFDDYIIVYPVDSGLDPVYVMFRDRREDPGVATGIGQPVSGIWLGAASQGKGVPIPPEIADQLRGKAFKNFREFRETLWKAVANNPELAKQFISNNISEMANGRAPFARRQDRVGGQVKFELHHVTYLSKGGQVYDIENIRIITPKRHQQIHIEDK